MEVLPTEILAGDYSVHVTVTAERKRVIFMKNYHIQHTLYYVQC
jgi:hypothetical protein